MSFFKGLKRALGFGNDYDEDAMPDADEEYLPDGAPRKRTPSYVNPFKNSDVVQQKASENDEVPAPVVNNYTASPNEIPSSVFDGVVELFNSSLPQFIKDSLNVETEKEAIVKAIGEPLKKYVHDVRDAALNDAHGNWDGERKSIYDKFKSAEQKLKDAETSVNEMKEKVQSTERQKQTLTERTHELESQIATIEAEREQIELENKSMVNKLRASNAKGEDAELYKKEMERLQAENEQLRKDTGLNELEHEFKKKMEATNALMNDFRASAAKKDLTIKELEEKLKANAEELEFAQEELKEANENMPIADDLKAQIDKIAEFKEKKNKEIAELKRQLKELEEAKQAPSPEAEKLLNKQIEELNNTLDSERMRYGQKEVQFNNKLDGLKAQIEAAASVIEDRNTVIESKNNEIAEMKAKLEALKASANAVPESIIEPELKQAVEETFNMSEEPVASKPVEVEPEQPVATPVETNHDVPATTPAEIDNIDDIDWLMPTPPSAPEPEAEPEEPKTDDSSSSKQMSLF